MWNRCFTAWKEVDNGRTSILSWKKNSVRNRLFWLSKVQEVLWRSCEQGDCFDAERWGHGFLLPRNKILETCVCALGYIYLKPFWTVVFQLWRVFSSCGSLLFLSFFEAEVFPDLVQDLQENQPLCYPPLYLARISALVCP